jgi:homoserine O-acetyltransferase
MGTTIAGRQGTGEQKSSNERGRIPASQGVGIVERRSMHFDFPADAPFRLAYGESLPAFDLSYETYGTLNDARDNAILLIHALTGDAHAAGRNDVSEPKPGWWDPMIGPGRPLDTDRYFIVCANALGGCSGSTGPCEINPATNRPWGKEFPLITVPDLVRAQRLLIDRLGIRRLAAVIGGSLGGMQALEWAVRYPVLLRRVPGWSAP